MILYFIRHAQSENNALWDNNGDGKGRKEDPDLTELGIRQAELMAEYVGNKNGDIEPRHSRDPKNLSGFNVNHIYCSLMVRAARTGLALSKKIDVPLIGWQDLHEIGGIVQGDGRDAPYEGQPGKNRSELKRIFPELVPPDSLGEEGWWNRPHEDRELVPVRAKTVIDRVLELHGDSDDQVALVTHGAFYNYMMKYLLYGGNTDRLVWFEMSNTGITRVDFRKDKFNPVETVGIIDYTNNVEFLPKEMIS